MRPKLNEEDKRSKPIGIKVKIETRKKLEFIASREQNTLSTQIDEIIKEYIGKYFKKYKINWENLSPEERGEVDG